MIFKIHYFTFNAGLSGVLVLITVFLRKYSDATSTEVGTLLMVLPFVAVFSKPFFCALADRHRKYRLYFILALCFTLLGFGSYTLLPFFPEFVARRGRAAWWLLVAATVVGYIAYGVVWSLGDAYAANVAHRTGQSFGMIRLWGTIGWGVAGACVGALSPYLALPEMVFGLLIFIATHLFEILLLICWPKASDFEMGAASSATDESSEKPQPEVQIGKQATMSEKPQVLVVEESQKGSDFVSISLSEGGKPSGRLQVCRTPSNSLAIVTKFKLADSNAEAAERSRQLAHFLDLDAHLQLQAANRCCCCCEPSGPPASTSLPADRKRLAERERELERRHIAQLQVTIFKMVARKHRSLFKYLAIFVALGAVYNCHWSYFFLHLEALAADGTADFSTLVGLCLVAQAVGETLCFMIAPWALRKLGRDGAISLNALAYAVRYFGNGLGIPLVSPYVAILTESLQGINYGIFYYLITDTALHYALLVDDVIPELQASGLLRKGADLEQVRTSLRATMQGVFSGAFDGLGFGLGSLAAGLVLERHSYEQLWCYAGATALLIFVLHALYEIGCALLRRRDSHARSYKRELERFAKSLESH